MTLERRIGRHLSPALYALLWKYCFRCDQITWRRHKHRCPHFDLRTPSAASNTEETP